MSGDPSGTWGGVQALPATQATWANQIILYAADPTDVAIARASASAAGLPSRSVITSSATAWAAALGGNHIVIAVGVPAASALYFNPCVWVNPSLLPAVSTPFSLPQTDLNRSLATVGPGIYVDAASDTGADTQTLATDVAYYALNGTLPPGASSTLPKVELPWVCAGTAS